MKALSLEKKGDTLATMPDRIPLESSRADAFLRKRAAGRRYVGGHEPLPISQHQFTKFW